MKKLTDKSKPLIDELLEEYLPKRYYGHEARKYAKKLALEYHRLIIKEKA